MIIVILCWPVNRYFDPNFHSIRFNGRPVCPRWALLYFNQFVQFFWTLEVKFAGIMTKESLKDLSLQDLMDLMIKKVTKILVLPKKSEFKNWSSKRVVKLSWYNKVLKARQFKKNWNTVNPNDQAYLPVHLFWKRVTLSRLRRRGL